MWRPGLLETHGTPCEPNELIKSISFWLVQVALTRSNLLKVGRLNLLEQLVMVHKILHVILKTALLRSLKRLLYEGIMILTIVSPNTGIVFF